MPEDLEDVAKNKNEHHENEAENENENENQEEPQLPQLHFEVVGMHVESELEAFEEKHVGKES